MNYSSIIVPSNNLLLKDAWDEFSIKIDSDLVLCDYVDEIIDQTVPYIECHRKCPAQSKCHYATKEAKCKVQILALQHFFKYARKEVNLKKRDVLDQFTRCAILYSKMVYDCYTFSYGAIEEWVWKYWRKFHLRFPYYSSSSVIESGHRFIDHISSLVPDLFIQKVLIVEGDCEEIIFRKIFTDPKYSHPRIERIENIKGEGNFRRIELLIKELRRQHLKIHILADGDGQMNYTVKNLRKKLIIQKDEYTLFTKSLEDAFPQNMVIAVFKSIMNKQYEQNIVEAAANAWNSKTLTFCRELKRLLLKTGTPITNATMLINLAKKSAARKFAVLLYKKIFDTPRIDLDKSPHEILRITHRLLLF